MAAPIVYNHPACLMSAPPTEPIVTCSGCGGKNPTGSTECDWCGRPFVSRGGRLRLTIWQLLSSLLLLGLIGAVAALAYLNQGRAVPPLRVTTPTTLPASTFVPTPVVTPRVSAATAPTATPASAVLQVGPTPPPTPQPPTPEPTPAPATQSALIVNTSGLGVFVRLQPGPQAQRAGVLREGTRVLLTGNDQTVAARPWREIETEDHNLKGWVQGDFLQLQPTLP